MVPFITPEMAKAGEEARDCHLAKIRSNAMTDKEKIDMLRNAMAALLRQTADPDPIHPAYQKAREDAAEAFQKTAA